MHTSPTPLLQPLTAPTPLAGLLNRWLVALAPTAALIDPRRPSAARECLQNVTSGAHFLHCLVGKVIARLEAGKDLQPLLRYVRHHRHRPYLGRPVVHAHLALALALRNEKLQTKHVYEMVSYTSPYLEKLLGQPSPFSADAALLEAVLEGASMAALYIQVLEEDEPDIEQTRTDIMDLLRLIVAADGEAIKRKSEEITLRPYLLAS
jgi:hypothetical protein